jgi:hypothetical protein
LLHFWWITYDMPRSACSVALETYHGASTIILRTLDWLLVDTFYYNSLICSSYMAKTRDVYIPIFTGIVPKIREILVAKRRGVDWGEPCHNIRVDFLTQ